MKILVKILAFLAFIAGFLAFPSCQVEPEAYIMTVKGPIPSDSLGTSLVHEHVLVDFIGADSTGYHRWDREEAARRILPYLEEVRDMGVEALFECTPAYLGRDPVLLEMLSRESGLHLVTNTGYYGAHGNRFLPSDFYELSVPELAELWIAEFEKGIEGSGIRPGFIKIGVDPQDSLSAEHVKIVKAAAMTHLQTGLVIASHTGPDGPAFEQLRILRSMGVDPSGFIWVHAQRGSLEGNIKAGNLGTWISLDNLNADRALAPEDPNSVNGYAERILALKEAGLLDRVLLSHDAGWYSPGEENGGNYRGYSGIFTHLIPALEARGFTTAELDQLFIGNPRNAYSITPAALNIH
jgi:phosphotriesterase-related protein